MKHYIAPTIEVAMLDKVNVIATSIGTLDPDTKISDPIDVCAPFRYDDEDDDF